MMYQTYCPEIDAIISENSKKYIDTLPIEYKLNDWCAKGDAYLSNIGNNAFAFRKFGVFGCGLSEELLNLLNCHTR